MAHPGSRPLYSLRYSSLSVEEAERMLQAWAAKGHLQVTVESGKLLYSLWEGGP